MAQHSHDPHHSASPVHPVDEKPAASAGAQTAVALNPFFHPLGTRSTPRAAVLSAASSGTGTQIP
ncbi:hypothetical protein [Streptomyces sp. NPDC048637]|uniref:hypothetical protein n=1 Tax=Streptomyces sp. NPDC048637 TaxID=3155636 RepID=UPI003433009F